MLANAMMLAQTQQPEIPAPSPIIIVVYLAVMVLVIAAWWKIFTKAGQPGWAAIIPIYNLYVMTQIAGRPAWWLILCLIPCVNIIILIILFIDIAKSFGQGAGFGIGMVFLGVIFVPILGFGSSQYTGPAARAGLPPQA